MKIKDYVVLDYDEYYAFATAKEIAVKLTLGTFANRTDFKIVPATLTYEASR